jgi:hypothetical protein
VIDLQLQANFVPTDGSNDDQCWAEEAHPQGQYAQVFLVIWRHATPRKAPVRFAGGYIATLLQRKQRQVWLLTLHTMTLYYDIKFLSTAFFSFWLLILLPIVHFLSGLFIAIATYPQLVTA